jgi:2-C-methyl-D-erythritol 4-phosphate cytidylyltransferase
MLTAIIVAAGSSRRVGFDKLMALLNGKTIIEHAVNAFERSDCVADIVIVTRGDRLKEFEEAIGKKNKIRRIVAGGEHRQDSVRAGLAALSSDATHVAVHDAARPLITSAQIERVFAAARETGAASLAEPATDTLKRADEKLRVTGSVDRQQLYAMQTPQIFARALLEEAYRNVAVKNLRITDEVSAVQELGCEVVLVPADDFNFKITFERDLRLAEFILRERTERG